MNARGIPPAAQLVLTVLLCLSGGEGTYPGLEGTYPGQGVPKVGTPISGKVGNPHWQEDRYHPPAPSHRLEGRYHPLAGW